MRAEIVDGALTRELRRRVLRPHLASTDTLPGDGLAKAVHVAVLDNGVAIGTCFVFEQQCYWRPGDVPSWRLQQMATDPDRRGEGVGAAVLALAHDVVAGRGARLLWCHARSSAVPFYAAHGWQSYGPEFVDEDTRIPHLHMLWEPPGSPSSSQS